MKYFVPIVYRITVCPLVIENRASVFSTKEITPIDFLYYKLRRRYVISFTGICTNGQKWELSKHNNCQQDSAAFPKNLFSCGILPKVNNVLKTVFQLLLSLAQSIGCAKAHIGCHGKIQNSLSIADAFFFIRKCVQNIPITIGFPLPAHLLKGDPYKGMKPENSLYPAEQVCRQWVTMADVGQLMAQNVFNICI